MTKINELTASFVYLNSMCFVLFELKLVDSQILFETNLPLKLKSGFEVYIWIVYKCVSCVYYLNLECWFCLEFKDYVMKWECWLEL